jgi:hypothetical protein
MAEPQPRDQSDDDLRQQQMIETLTDAVESGDCEFAVEIAGSQQLLRPFVIVEYMDVKRRSSEDPVASRRWEEALLSYLRTLSGAEFPEEEIEVINNVVSSLKFDAITSGIDTTEEAGIETTDKDVEEDYNWANSEFLPDVEKEELERLRGFPVFQRAESYAQGKISGRTINDAIILIYESVSGGPNRDNMLKAIDWYIAQKAESYAQGKISGRTINDALTLISECASDDEARAMMNSSIDKHVFQRAESYAQGKISGRTINDAKELIIAYASTPGRRDAMLRTLGFI